MPKKFEIDEISIKRAQHNRNDLENLLEVIFPFVFSVSKKYCKPPLDPLDTTQDSLILISKNIKSFQFKSTFTTWVYTITYRCFLKNFQKSGREIPTEQLDETSQANVDQSIYYAVSECFEQLSVDHQQILYLIDIQEETYEIAAYELGIPIGTVRSRVARARIALKNLLDKRNFFESSNHLTDND